MADNTRKAAKLKLIMGIVIPVFIMISSLIMVGASFAWFSDSANVEIATINLATKKVFTLDFSSAGDIDSEYHGENAISSDGYLVSDYRNITNGFGDKYIEDKPSMFKTTIGLSTDNTSVDLTMNFKMVQIELDFDNDEDTTDDIYDLAVYGVNNPKTLPPARGTTKIFETSEIPFAFTWFFIKHGETLSSVTEREDGSYGVDVYTPYGHMVLDYPRDNEGAATASYLVAKTINGVAVTGSTSILADSAKADIQDFQAGEGEKVSYDFYVVFAPEKLFWMQYLPADRDRPYYNNNNNGVYSAAVLTRDIAGVNDVASCSKMYYAAPSYTGSTFYFVAEINVTNVDGE